MKHCTYILYITYILIFFLIHASTVLAAKDGNVAYTLEEKGVPRAMAVERKRNISDLRYDLRFDIPLDVTQDVEGKETVHCTLDKRSDLVLDFREDARKIHSVRANGRKCPVVAEYEHLVVPGRFLRKGLNRIEIEFTAGGQSLNRREGYLYTLFVPDRARTVFPCFDQPDLKASFTLELEIPSHWKAVSNNAIEEEILRMGQAGPTSQAPEEKSESNGGRKILRFKPTSPLPTYLFAFAAGEFEYQFFPEQGIGAYYRESDPAKTAQLQDIARQVEFALKWLEEFTGVPYPFEKYDFVVLPGFQFGGMEHAGATFYNDTRLFLSANPTPDERLRQTELIAHETSHMWFGDAVTMEWFNDVWTKEVFANYFAAEITAPLYPGLDHELNWLKTYKAAAVSQDRTQGRTSIRQELDNMCNAGLIYNSIIYNKAPVMMRSLVEMMGRDAFREGVREYVRKHLYGNATWDDLIEILSGHTDADIRSFSREWVDSEMWPHFRAVSFRDALDSEKYGFIELSREQTDSLMAYFPTVTEALPRQAALMNLYENFCAGNIGDGKWTDFLIESLRTENDQLAASSMISYLAEPMLRALSSRRRPDVNRRDNDNSTNREASLWEMADSHPLPSVRTQVLRLLMKNGSTEPGTERFLEIWSTGQDERLSETDFMTLTYELAVRLPEKADSLIAVQRARLTDPDRIRQFDFISRAVRTEKTSGGRDEALTFGKSSRDSLFESLSEPSNRRIEPWVLSVLYYLNHPLRDEESVKYIRPSLDLLSEIQRTGDIFFPGNWCEKLLAGHRCDAALNEVRKFLADNPGLHPLLRKKILQAMFFLERANLTESANSTEKAD